MARQAKHTDVFSVWQQAAQEGDDGMRRLVERVVQEVLETEITRFLEAEPYERTRERRGYRNGYKPRLLKTRVGTLELLVPKDREGQFQTELFERYQRSEKALLLAIMPMYLEGVSTRKVRAITEELCGPGDQQEPGLGPQPATGRGDPVVARAAAGEKLSLPGRGCSL
jgi:transposase-like protein